MMPFEKYVFLYSTSCCPLGSILSVAVELWTGNLQMFLETEGLAQQETLGLL